MPVNAIAMPFSFAVAIDSSSLIDPQRLVSGLRMSPLSFWERLGDVAKLESQNRKPDPGLLFAWPHLLDRFKPTWYKALEQSNGKW